MEYRTLGRTGWQVSTVSLGTEYLMDLPREQAVPVIHEALAQGINYFDVFGAAPEFRDNMGAAFAGQREKALLAAHLGCTHTSQYEATREASVAEPFFYDFLTRYHTDYADVLFLHNIDAQADYDRVMQGGMRDLALRLKQEGKARAIGFSGHTVETARQAVESGVVDVLMFPINLTGNVVDLSGNAKPGMRELFTLCAQRGVGVVAMKPYAGGNLLKGEQAVSPVRCLGYALAQTGVSTVVPGCRDVEQLHAALAWLTASEEERDFSSALARFQNDVSGQCVYCNHCLPCPEHINVGDTLRLLDLAQGGVTPELQAAYNALPWRASDCAQCGSCSERCPFGVDVTSKMEEAARLYEK